MRIVKSMMRYAIIENNNIYFVMSKDPKQNKQFETLEQAETYFNKLTDWVTRAQANAPSWD